MKIPKIDSNLNRYNKNLHSIYGGVSILMVTPLDNAGRLCEKDFVNLIKFVTQPSLENETINSVTVCGEMGEGYCLTKEDWSRAITLARQTLQSVKAVIAAVFSLSLRDAIEQARLARDSGADALLLAPVATFPYSINALCKYFESVAEAVQLPIIAYLNKMFKSPPPTDEIIKAVYDLPCVIGIKDSTGDIGCIEKLISLCPENKLMIHTVSSNALDSLAKGANALMLGTSNLVPEAVLRLWTYGRSQEKKDQEMAKSAQLKISQVVQLYKLAPDAASKDWVIVKEALYQMGIISQESKYPAVPYEILMDDDQKKVSSLLKPIHID